MQSSLTESRERRPRALMLIENQTLPVDRRVMAEAQSLVANGYVVSVICPAQPGQPLRESISGITIRRYRPRFSRGGARSQIAEYANALLKTLWHMIGLARSPGFDVIHAGNPPDLFFLTAWPFRLLGKRFIFDQHDLSPELYLALYGRDRGLIMSLLRWSERRSYRQADAVLATNASYKRLACSRGGVAPDRVFIVRNGPREGWPGPVPADPSLKRGRPLLVLYMGIMGFQDGVDILLLAIDKLVHSQGFHDATFALVGDGNAGVSLRRLTASLGIAEWIDFAGWIEDKDLLARYLVTADACVCPEPASPLNDHSTFVKVMEYMAAGKPMVAFDLPESRFSAGEAALYAKPGDVDEFATLLRQVLTDDALRANMATSAAERLPMLRWERQVPSLLAAYDRALARRQ